MVCKTFYLRLTIWIILIMRTNLLLFFVIHNFSNVFPIGTVRAKQLFAPDQKN